MIQRLGGWRLVLLRRGGTPAPKRPGGDPLRWALALVESSRGHLLFSSMPRVFTAALCACAL